MTKEERRSQPPSIHEQLDSAADVSEAVSADEPPTFDDAEAEVAFWRAQFEEERERLAKLWVAYRDLEAELETLREATDEIGEAEVARRLEAEDPESETSQPDTPASEAEQDALTGQEPGSQPSGDEPAEQSAEAEETSAPETREASGSES